MTKKLVSRTALILSVLALVAFFGSGAAQAAEPTGPATPAISAQAPDAPQLPADGSDLFAPKPISQCKTNWCSSTAQCQQWFGPDWFCNLGPGATCGLCQELA